MGFFGNNESEGGLDVNLTRVVSDSMISRRVENVIMRKCPRLRLGFCDRFEFIMLVDVRSVNAK